MKSKKTVDFSVFGLVCRENDYRLSYFLNKELMLGLEKNPSQLVFKKKGQSFNEDLFAGHVPGLDFWLFSNGVWLPKNFSNFKNIDYWLLIDGQLSSEKSNSLYNSLVSVSVILACFRIEDENLIDFLRTIIKVE